MVPEPDLPPKFTYGKIQDGVGGHFEPPFWSQVYDHNSQGKSRHDAWKKFRTGGMARVTWPRKFWALNANSSKMTKDTNFKFGTYAPTESPDLTPEKIFERGVARVMWSLKFWALIANSSKITKDTNFKFGTHAPRQNAWKVIFERGRGHRHVIP